jgi:ABC-2 type transport system permease protein
VNPFRLYVRIVQRGTVVWTAIPAIIVASGIATYNGIYPTHASRVQLMSQLGNNRAFAALEGQAVYINTPGGFVVWKYSAILTTLVALWALLSVSKLLRGDEERGRTDLLVAGPVSITTQLAVQLGVMAAAVSVGGVAVASAAGCSVRSQPSPVSCWRPGAKHRAWRARFWVLPSSSGPWPRVRVAIGCVG